MGRLLRLAHVTITWTVVSCPCLQASPCHRESPAAGRAELPSGWRRGRCLESIRANAAWLWMLSSLAASTAEPGHPAVIAQRARRGARHVLDEHRIIVRPHRDITFVGPFEQREDRAGGRGFRDFDEFLHPHHGGHAALVARLDPQGDVAALVVGPVVADRLAARAHAGNRHPYGHGENRAAVRRCGPTAGIGSPSAPPSLSPEPFCA